MSPTTTRSPVPDQICANAADLARTAVEEVAGQVGPHLGIAVDADRAVSHMFGCLDPAYAGWRWEVTVTRAARAKTATVSESQLMPGPDALLAPVWVPWSERVRPGDLGIGDLMPASSADERLVPVVAIDGDDGLLDWEERQEGPARVLSAFGREEAASRWYAGQGGERTARANAAPGPCLTCGFMVRVSGPLGRMFGVCANEYAPDDGRVVSVDHGCGAHSDPMPRPPAKAGPLTPAVDEIGYDLAVPAGAALPADAALAEEVVEALDPGLA